MPFNNNIGNLLGSIMAAKMCRNVSVLFTIRVSGRTFRVASDFNIGTCIQGCTFSVLVHTHTHTHTHTYTKYMLLYFFLTIIIIARLRLTVITFSCSHSMVVIISATVFLPVAFLDPPPPPLCTILVIS